MDVADVGNWWGAGDKELDVVAVNSQGSVVLVGSCKWTNAPMDMGEYAALLSDVKTVAPHLRLDCEAIDHGDGPWLALFSRSGFTQGLKDLADQQAPRRLLLYSEEDLYSAPAESARLKWNSR